MTEPLSDYEIGQVTAAMILGLNDNPNTERVEEIAPGTLIYSVKGIPFALIVDPVFNKAEPLVDENGNTVELEEGDLIFKADEVSLVRSLLALVAMSPECSRLAEGIDNLRGDGEDPTDDEVFRFTIGEDSCGNPCVREANDTKMV